MPEWRRPRQPLQHRAGGGGRDRLRRRGRPEPRRGGQVQVCPAVTGVPARPTEPGGAWPGHQHRSCRRRGKLVWRAGASNAVDDAQTKPEFLPVNSTRKYMSLAAMTIVAAGVSWAATVQDVRAPEPAVLNNIMCQGCSVNASWVENLRVTTGFRLP